MFRFCWCVLARKVRVEPSPRCIWADSSLFVHSCVSNCTSLPWFAILPPKCISAVKRLHRVLATWCENKPTPWMCSSVTLHSRRIQCIVLVIESEDSEELSNVIHCWKRLLSFLVVCRYVYYMYIYIWFYRSVNYVICMSTGRRRKGLCDLLKVRCCSHDKGFNCVACSMLFSSTNCPDVFTTSWSHLIPCKHRYR